MSDEELLALNRIGFIPGPGEGEKAFRTRIAQTKERFEQGEWIPASHWDWVRESLDSLFDVKPLYICAFYSNRSLTPWQGAATWIEGQTLHSIQLRERFRTGSYLGLYCREEILAHEAVHAIRSAFHEPLSEEFFAYMTSEKRWRQILGPIIQKPWEIWPFLSSLILGVLWPIFFLGAGLWAALGFVRLIRHHGTLSRAAAHIVERVGDSRITRAILLRLTDEEIRKFSRGESIDAYEKGQNCLRWRVIRAYLHNKKVY